jgi:hypothetical protein
MVVDEPGGGDVRAGTRRPNGIARKRVRAFVALTESAVLVSFTKMYRDSEYVCS